MKLPLQAKILACVNQVFHPAPGCRNPNERAARGLWATADQHTENGVMLGLTLHQLDRKTGVPGFGSALCQVHWIEEHPEGIFIIHFDEHNGASAKRRREDARRKSYVRKDSDKNGTNPGIPADNDGRIAELEKEKEKRERGAGRQQGRGSECDAMNEPVRALAELPNIETARLPAVYENARLALAECTKVDECRDWADRAATMASYAKKSKDESLYRMAMRIQARATRRCGELLTTFQVKGGDRKSEEYQSRDAPTSITQRQAAADAGLSKDQEVQAVRLSKIPEDEFNDAVESDTPPTVTALATQGTQAKPNRSIEQTQPYPKFLLSGAKLLHGTKPRTGGYLAATYNRNEKSPLSFQ